MRDAGNEYSLNGRIDILNGIFRDYPNADKVIIFIKQKNSKALLGETIPSDICTMMEELAHIERTIGEYENPNKLLDVLQTINLTLSDLAKNLPSMGLDINNGYCQALLKLPDVIKQAVEQAKQAKQARGASPQPGYEKKEQLAIHRTTLKFLEEKNIHKPYLYNDNNANTLEKLKIGQGISVWIMASLYIKLHKMLPRG